MPPATTSDRPPCQGSRRTDDAPARASAAAPRAGRRRAARPAAAGPRARRRRPARSRGSRRAAATRAGARTSSAASRSVSGSVRRPGRRAGRWPPRPTPKLTSAPKDGSSTISTTVETPGAAISWTITGSPDGMARERRTDRVGVVQVEPHAAEVGPVPQPGRGRLQHHRVADRLGGGDRRLGVGRRPCAQQRHAVGGQQGDQLVVGQLRPAGAAARTPATTARAGRLVDVGQLGQLPDRAGAASGRTRRPWPARSPPAPASRTTGTEPRAGMPVLVEDGQLGRDALGGEEAWRRSAWSTSAATSRSAGPNSCEPAMSGGRNTATTASTRSSSTASCSAARKSSGRAVGADVDRRARGPAAAPPRARRRRPASPSRSSCRRSRPGRPPGSGWWASSGADVEQLRHRLDADHPGRGEQRGHRLLGHGHRRAGQPAGDRARAARSSPPRPAWCGRRVRASRANLRGLPKLSR